MARTPRMNRAPTAAAPFRRHVFHTWEDFKNGIRGALPGGHDYDVYKNYIFRGLEKKAPEGQLQIISVQDYENSRLGSQFGLFTYLKTNEGSLEDSYEQGGESGPRAREARATPGDRA